MKKLLLSVLVLFAFYAAAQTAKHEKPRYLKFSTFLTPIDMSKAYDKEGLLKSNTSTISISKSPIMAFEIKKAEDNSDVKVRKELIDTLLIKTIMIEKGYAFDVVQEIGSFSIIKFWNLKESKGNSLMADLKDLTAKNKGIAVDNEFKFEDDYSSFKIDGLVADIEGVPTDLTKIYFIVPTKTVVTNSVEFENKNGAWNIGLLVMPVKIRPFATESGQFDFSDGVSVGTTLSWTIYHNFRTDFTHNLLLYVGVSSYTADESKIKEKREDYKIATFSPAVGWMWEKKSVQLSLLAGVDFPAGNLQKQWVYRNMPWFGMGLGIGLFKISNDNASKNEKQVK